MKTQLLSLLIAAACFAPGGVARAFVYETSAEFQADGDFDGDGRPDLVIADKATGVYRLGYQLSETNYTWVAARASGVKPLTGFNLGKLITLTNDALVFTGVEANRINILDASSSSSAGLPASVFIPSLGPNMVGAIDIGGSGPTPHDDLYVCSIYNGDSNPRETLVRNNGSTRTVLADNPLFPVTAWLERANKVTMKTNLPPRLGVFIRKISPATDEFRVCDFASGSASVTFGLGGMLGSPTPSEYVFAQFATTNSLTQFLFYHPSNDFFLRYQVVESPPGSTNFSLPSGSSFAFPQTIDRIFVLPATNGAKLLILFAAGASAGVYDFDGVTAPTPVQTFTADPGEHFTGAGVMGKSGFMAYSAPLGQNTTSKFKQWNWNGTGYTASASGNLPGVSQFTASGNVLQFQYEPFITNQPVLLRINNAGDWSSKPALGASLLVQSETFAGPTQGLVNPVPVSIGAVHPLAHFGLANQYSNAISLFSFTPPQGDKVSEVSISPAPGKYPTAITVKFTVSDTSHSVYYRIGKGSWSQFTNQPIRLFADSTVQYYGRVPAGAAQSAIQSASYTFTTSSTPLDSDNDGVPDFVEAALGLDPNGGSDSDGDGYSDLEELLHVTNPLATNSVPTNWPHLDDQAVFDLTVKPLPWDGFSNRVTLCATGVTLSAYTMQGGYLGASITTNPPQPFARLTNIAVNPLDRVFAHTTPQHYSLLTTNPNTIVGREMIGLLSMPSLEPFSVPFTYVGTNPPVEATNWIIAASNAWLTLKRAVLSNDLTFDDSLAALLFERKIALLLGDRTNTWFTNMTLFPWRPSDSTRTNPPQSLLLSLETNLDSTHPGFRLQTVLATITNSITVLTNPDVPRLLAVAQDIYRINSRYNNDYPATFASPIDELRYFIWFGTLDSNYLAWATTSNHLASASNAVAAILAAVSPRPTTNLTLLVRADTFGPTCRILDQPGTNAPYALLNPSGLPFTFPQNFLLPPGSEVPVYGYTDVTNNPCPYPAIEVLAIALADIPEVTDPDSDANLLVDSWERKFFGRIGVDPYADDDGDGYTNLQEYLGGSDPSDRFSVPAETSYRVSGQVAMEGYVGIGGDGVGSRIVTFKATDNAGTVLSQWNLFLNFTGGVASYACNGVPATTTHISAKTAWSLRKRQAVSFTAGEATANFTGARQLPAGDIDASNVVDLDDYFLLASFWFTTDPASDLNGNGLVYLDDYYLMAGRWYQVGDPE